MVDGGRHSRKEQAGSADNTDHGDHADSDGSAIKSQHARSAAAGQQSKADRQTLVAREGTEMTTPSDILPSPDRTSMAVPSPNAVAIDNVSHRTVHTSMPCSAEHTIIDSSACFDAAVDAAAHGQADNDNHHDKDVAIDDVSDDVHKVASQTIRDAEAMESNLSDTAAIDQDVLEQDAAVIAPDTTNASAAAEHTSLSKLNVQVQGEAVEDDGLPSIQSAPNDIDSSAAADASSDSSSQPAASSIEAPLSYDNQASSLFEVADQSSVTEHPMQSSSSTSIQPQHATAPMKASSPHREASASPPAPPLTPSSRLASLSETQFSSLADAMMPQSPLGTKTGHASANFAPPDTPDGPSSPDRLMTSDQSLIAGKHSADDMYGRLQARMQELRYQVEQGDYEIKTDVCWQYQRRWPLLQNYSAENLLPYDEHAWCDDDRKKVEPMDERPVPLEWERVEDWQVDISIKPCDTDGWQYGTTGFFRTSHTPGLFHLLRRRRLTRRRAHTGNVQMELGSRSQYPASSTGDMVRNVADWIGSAAVGLLPTAILPASKAPVSKADLEQLPSDVFEYAKTDCELAEFLRNRDNGELSDVIRSAGDNSSEDPSMSLSADEDASEDDLDHDEFDVGLVLVVMDWVKANMFKLATQLALYQDSEVVPDHVILDIHQRQGGRCPACDDPITYVDVAEIGQHAKLCFFTGKVYCQGCHHGETCVIPARVCNLMDFGAHSVCCKAAEGLALIKDVPLYRKIDLERPDGLRQALGAETEMPLWMEENYSVHQGRLLIQIVSLKDLRFKLERKLEQAMTQGLVSRKQLDQWLRDAFQQRKYLYDSKEDPLNDNDEPEFKVSMVDLVILIESDGKGLEKAFQEVFDQINAAAY
eukprot:TRINITY_DN11786_c0_g1_i2.p1 TRINITY_DN11786_c0_g1~~TRINITY_DN11786_c0_g1_i2.p1  ORF type:complete len:978 (+),score=206.61 TRINITY_DN11786_c0_g1_i2:318-2936(+)